MIFIDPVDPMLWFTLAFFVGFALLVKILVAKEIMQVTPVNQMPRTTNNRTPIDYRNYHYRSIIAKIHSSGEFSVEAANEYGCVSTDTVTVEFEECPADTVSCGYSTGMAYEWPGNRNWFLAAPSVSWDSYGYIYNSLTGVYKSRWT